MTTSDSSRLLPVNKPNSASPSSFLIRKKRFQHGIKRLQHFKRKVQHKSMLNRQPIGVLNDEIASLRTPRTLLAYQRIYNSATDVGWRVASTAF